MCMVDNECINDTSCIISLRQFPASSIISAGNDHAYNIMASV